MLPSLFRQRPELTFDLITVDGDHTPRGARRDILDVLPRLRIGGVLVFDDVRHPYHPKLGDVWRRAVDADPRYVDVGVRRCGLRRRARDQTVVVLVTGARGFLGRHVCDRLRTEGHDVLAAGRPEMQIPSPALDDLLVSRAPDAVVHCATPASVPGLDRAARRGSRRLGRGARAAAYRSVCAACAHRASSSCRARLSMGSPGDFRSRRTSLRSRSRLTGVTASTCEGLVESYADAAGVAAVNLRVFSAYGEGLRRQVLWEICRQALAGGQVELAGTGDETRDFVHARDVAGAVAIAVEREAEGAIPLNVAGGRATSIRTLAEQLAYELGVGEQMVTFTGATRPGDPRYWLADVGRARALGWAPRVSLAAGLAAYAAWARTASYAGSSWSR